MPRILLRSPGVRKRSMDTHDRDLQPWTKVAVGSDCYKIRSSFPCLQKSCSFKSRNSVWPAKKKSYEWLGLQAIHMISGVFWLELQFQLFHAFVVWKQGRVMVRPRGPGSAQEACAPSGCLGLTHGPAPNPSFPHWCSARGGSDDLRVGSLSPTRETYTEALASGVSSPACCRCSRNEAVNGGLYFCLFGKRNAEARWLFWILTGESGFLYFFS